MTHSLTRQPSAVRLGDADLAAVEHRDRPRDGVGLYGRLLRGAARRAARCPRPACLSGSQHLLEDRRRAAKSSIVGTSAKRTKPSPAAPRNAPGATTIPCSSSRWANRRSVSPAGILTHRYMPATLPRISRPVPGNGLRQHHPLDPVALARLDDMGFVSPRGDRRTLDELLRGRADGRTNSLSAAMSAGGPATKPER